MDEPTLDDTMPDNERLTRALQEAGGVENVRLPYFVIKKLPDVLRDSHFHVKCVVKKNKHGFYVYDIRDAAEDVKDAAADGAEAVKTAAHEAKETVKEVVADDKKDAE